MLLKRCTRISTSTALLAAALLAVSSVESSSHGENMHSDRVDTAIAAELN